MKKLNNGDTRTAVHIVNKEILQPYNPVTINLIGAGGTGGQVLTALARMNYALVSLNHPGLMVSVFDDDTVTRANLGRQLFTTAELGLHKSVALINRINRFFGTNWKAVTEKYDKTYNGDNTWATLTIGCVDTVQARVEIAQILKKLNKSMGNSRSQPLYYMDFGNSRETGQVILSTIGKIQQPESKQYRTTDTLPMVTDEFAELLAASEAVDNTPSCSLAEALTKQDLFINSALANCGASLLWQMFREGMLFNRGFFLNLKEFKTQPLKVA
ncbi:PRTRC system ThiF family protein [Mucilaginibacter sp. BJC16-A38]|uniref:PRTRC system ThiF family protein n=1 Tax=Mucilaginibacter phenanthrenivorans TaxID=1234842 RepID=UPI0021579FA1|nr:PRTRC system ThiF family protein [Mucilaginibacter phenanthrenivorans]MCR8557369.1 PRTRC system ThiF family protein [Mucilaginibacter phenanthrenivorans]